MRPDQIAKSEVGEMRDDLEKGGGRVHVGEYTRVDPRSGKVVHVSSYDRSVVARGADHSRPEAPLVQALTRRAARK